MPNPGPDDNRVPSFSGMPRSTPSLVGTTASKLRRYTWIVCGMWGLGLLLSETGLLRNLSHPFLSDPNHPLQRPCVPWAHAYRILPALLAILWTWTAWQWSKSRLDLVRQDDPLEDLESAIRRVRRTYGVLVAVGSGVFFLNSIVIVLLALGPDGVVANVRNSSVWDVRFLLSGRRPRLPRPGPANPTTAEAAQVLWETSGSCLVTLPFRIEIPELGEDWTSIQGCCQVPDTATARSPGLWWSMTQVSPPPSGRVPRTFTLTYRIWPAGGFPIPRTGRLMVDMDLTLLNAWDPLGKELIQPTRTWNFTIDLDKAVSRTEPK